MDTPAGDASDTFGDKRAPVASSDGAGSFLDLDLDEAFRIHGPTEFDDDRREWLRSRIIQGSSINLVVLACDIRRSTFLMKEAVYFIAFADILNSFISTARKNVREHGGFFDKFTGDGFLAYWIYDDDPQQLLDAITQPLITGFLVIDLFRDDVMDDFRLNSRNFPEGVGLAVGIDAGPTYIVEVASDLTIVGPAVVGAVRMAGVASSSELIANVYIGRALQQLGPHATPFRVGSEFRQTKEYRQEVFPVELDWSAAMGDHGTEAAASLPPSN